MWLVAAGKYEKWLTSEGLDQLEGWARNGLTDEDIAHNMGITRSTLAEWKKKHSDISDALKCGRECADLRVENQLYRNATGYDYTEQQAIKVKRVYWDANGRRCEAEDVKIIDIKRHHVGETTAQIFWLKNRRAEDWRDKVITEQEGPVSVAVEMYRGQEKAE
jgi:transcriptional regulator with XRE-family HTH domain